MTKRSYNQQCSLAYALDIVGERWTLLLVREFMTGPKRFTDLQHNMPGMGTNLLSERLKQLEAAKVIHRRRLPPPSAAAVYELTDLGQDLSPAVVALAEWGLKAGRIGSRAEHYRPGWTFVGMYAAFRPEETAGLHERYEFRIGDEVFYVRVDDGALETGQGPSDDPDAVITTTVDTFRAVVTGERSMFEAVNSADATVEGDATALDRLARMFGRAA